MANASPNDDLPSGWTEIWPETTESNEANVVPVSTRTETLWSTSSLHPPAPVFTPDADAHCIHEVVTKTSTTTVWATLTVNRGSATTSSQQGNGSLVSAPAPVVTGGDDDEVSSTVTATTTTTTTVWVDEEGNALSPTSAFAVPCHATPTAQPGALTPIEPGPYPTANSSGLVLPTGFTRPGSGSVSGTITDHVSAPAPTETVPVTSGGGKMIGGTGSALVLGALTVAVAMCVM